MRRKYTPANCQPLIACKQKVKNVAEERRKSKKKEKCKRDA